MSSTLVLSIAVGRPVLFAAANWMWNLDRGLSPTSGTKVPSGVIKEGKGSHYSITERRVPELIPVLCSQPAGDVSHKPGGRLPLLSARPAFSPATLKRTATNSAAW